MNTDVIVIGTGPVGIRTVEEIQALDADLSISLYGNEPYPYNRVKLTRFLADRENLSSLENFPKIQKNTALKIYNSCAIVDIDTDNKMVYRADGNTECYNKLVLASGSYPRIPNLQHTDFEGIFMLRTLADAERLKNRDGDNLIVVGGGVLGLEIACALRRLRKGSILVIDHASSLMSRQLHKEAGDLVLEKVLRNGIQVSLASGIKTLNGTKKLESVTLRNNREIQCDTLVFAVGVRANIDLARRAGIVSRRGIVIDDRLQTSAPDVYAVGDCVEFKKKTYGVVTPGYEQAKVVAANVCGRKKRYYGSIPSTYLQALDYPVFSMGAVGEEEPLLAQRRLTYEEPMRYLFRHIIIHRWRIIGCIALGEWSEINHIRDSIENKKRIWPWELKRFQMTGFLWAEPRGDSVLYWPNHALVCHCSRVTRGELGGAINNGCRTTQELSAQTRAGMTCDFCIPLLSDLLGHPIEPAKGHRSLAVLSLITMLAWLLGTGISASSLDSMKLQKWYLSILGNVNGLKLVSGYGLLGCSLLLLTLTLRKRLDKLTFGDFAWWRLVHVLVGLLTFWGLAVHTGFSFGDNITFYLMSTYSAVLAVGAMVGLVIALEHKLKPRLARKLRTRLLWLHILLLWPLPVLLGFHIYQSYPL